MPTGSLEAASGRFGAFSGFVLGTRVLFMVVCLSVSVFSVFLMFDP